MANQFSSVHQSPSGPGDARPTAIRIIEDGTLEGTLNGSVALITGCSSGIGVETARAMFLAGATLYLAARNVEKAKAVLGELAESDRIHILELDLESFASVRACASEFLLGNPTLDILICSAGVMATPKGRTRDGFETQFGTNHLGHFILFNLLQPALLAAAKPARSSRVIVVSSSAHRFGGVNFDNINFDGSYDHLAAYAASKTANLWTANEIECRYGWQGIHTWSVHLGFVATNLGQHMPDGQWEGIMADPYMASILKNPNQGASTTI